MSRVAKMHLGDCPALKGFAGRRRGMGMGDTDRLAESALDLCVCYGAIYEETVAPFPCLFATEAAVQILAVRLHLLPLWDSPPHLLLSWFPTLYRYTLHLSNTQRKTDTQ